MQYVPRHKKFAYSGLLLGLGAIALSYIPSAIAQTKPRPSIFNEAPYNRSRPAVESPTPPLIQQRQAPVATLQPANGTVSIRLINKTYTTINYQVVGDTQSRQLAGQSETTLQDLKLPADLSFYRPDRGFLLTDARISPTNPGTLEITFNATDNQDIGKTALTIQETGEAFIY